MRIFTDVLRDIERGRLVERLTDAQMEVIKGVQETYKKGSLTLTLTYEPDGEQIRVRREVKLKIPEQSGSALFFLTDGGDLVVNNPNQQEMPLRSAEEPMMIDKETGEVLGNG